MSGGSQHNPNGRQSQLGASWSPLQLQMANLLARAPQAHMASERGLTWHTPTPPPHLYHVPVPSPPDPLQAMKSAGSNSVYRHTATPPELYRHTPTPPDKHGALRHTPSPGDAKTGAGLPPAEMYQHLGAARDKLVRPEELLAAYARGVDLSLSGSRGANGSPAPAAHTAYPAHPAHPPHAASPALSVRDAPTINSLIARAQPRHPHAKFDAILERLVPSPVSPHSVIVHSRSAPTPSPPSNPSSNEDSADSCSLPPGAKRKRKPERTLRVPAVSSSAPPPASAPTEGPAPPSTARISPPIENTPRENGDASRVKQNGPNLEKPPSPLPTGPHARKKTRSGSAETIDDIAAMIASTNRHEEDHPTDICKADDDMDIEPPVTAAKLESVLASPEPSSTSNPPPKPEAEEKCSPIRTEEVDKEKPLEPPAVEAATAPRRRSTRTSNSESTNVPVESPSEAKPAEAEVSGQGTAEPTAASFVEVENQLEKMFAGIEEEAGGNEDEAGTRSQPQTSKAKRRRRKSVATKGERKTSRRSSRTSTGDEGPRQKVTKKSEGGKVKKTKEPPTKETKDAYDSCSNASSSRSRGPYIQIRGEGASPASVTVVNAGADEDERRKPDDFRNGMRARGLHASTLGLRYDATTPDATWLCAFCERGPHANALGDLFGPYTLDTDCEEYSVLDEASRRRYGCGGVVWMHAGCALWAPGLVAAGARVRGLAAAVWGARAARCAHCPRAGAALACAARPCRARAHLPCAAAHHWRLSEEHFTALCPKHVPN